MSNLPTPGVASPQGVRPPPDIPDLFGRADKNVPVKEGESRKTWVLAGALATAMTVLFVLVIMVGVLLDRDGSCGGCGDRCACPMICVRVPCPAAGPRPTPAAVRARVPCFVCLRSERARARENSRAREGKENAREKQHTQARDRARKEQRIWGGGYGAAHMGRRMWG